MFMYDIYIYIYTLYIDIDDEDVQLFKLRENANLACRFG